MRYILTILIITAAFNTVMSQAVTIILKDSTTQVGYVIKEDSSRIKFSPNNGFKYQWYNKSDILNYAKIADKLDLHNDRGESTALPSECFSRAGGFGVASVLFLIGGVASTSIGALNGSKIATYAGVGLSGTGLVLLIPTFTNIMSGARQLRLRQL